MTVGTVPHFTVGLVRVAMMISLAHRHRPRRLVPVAENGDDSRHTPHKRSESAENKSYLIEFAEGFCERRSRIVHEIVRAKVGPIVAETVTPLKAGFQAKGFGD